MTEFEDKFVHFRWDDSLKGKKVFYADCISTLENDVAEGEDYRELLRYSGNEACPFTIKSSDGEQNNNWQFVYYDPNYEAKRAYERGKLIEHKSDIDDEWYVDVQPTWEEGAEYRIKPQGLQWTDLGIGDVITDGETTAMVVVSSSKSYPHIFIGYRWLTDVELKDWRKVKNG